MFFWPLGSTSSPSPSPGHWAPSWLLETTWPMNAPGLSGCQTNSLADLSLVIQRPHCCSFPSFILNAIQVICLAPGFSWQLGTVLVAPLLMAVPCTPGNWVLPHLHARRTRDCLLAYCTLTAQCLNPSGSLCELLPISTIFGSWAPF